MIRPRDVIRPWASQLRLPLRLQQTSRISSWLLQGVVPLCGALLLISPGSLFETPLQQPTADRRKAFLSLHLFSVIP